MRNLANATFPQAQKLHQARTLCNTMSDLKSDKQGTCNYISVSTICKVLLEFFYTCHAEPYDDNSSRNQSLIAQSRVAKPDIALEPSELHIFLLDFKKNLSLRQFKQKPIMLAPQLETITDLLIKLGMKPCIHLVEISISFL